MEKKILDVTCGARSIWFNKHHPAAVYCDKRREQYHHLWKNAGNCTLDINPDVVCDFTDLPFPNNSFPLVVFDPPHLTGAKETAWLVKKYSCRREEKPVANFFIIQSLLIQGHPPLVFLVRQHAITSHPMQH